MKRRISVILVLALMFSLSVSAQAAAVETEPSYDYWFDEESQAWIDAHPQEVEQFLANELEAYSLEAWGMSFDELVEYYGSGEAYVRDMLLEWWAYENIEDEEWAAFKARYEAEHPGGIAALEANAYDYFTQSYTWYSSPEEYRQTFGLTEEEFLDQMVEEQLWEAKLEAERQDELDEMKSELGGTPGQLGVLLNGAYLSFPDAAPEAVDGRIMVPYRPLMEALGGSVAYDEASQTVTCTLDGAVLTLALGGTALTVERDGETSALEMDCAAYAREGRTYVPVRFISQAFGYDVLWDQAFETAVLLDREALVAAADQNFTILNRALEKLQGGSGQAYQSECRAELDLTLFDSLHGDKTYQFSAQMDNLFQGAAVEGTLKLDLSDLMEIVGTESLREDLWYMDETELAMVEAVVENLAKTVSISYIVDAAQGDLWLRVPLLGLADSELADAWLHAGWDPQLLPAFDLEEDMTVGGLVYAALLASAEGEPDYSYDYGRAVWLWDDMQSAIGELTAVVGDSCFVQTEAGDTFTFDLQDIYAQQGGLYSDDGQFVVTFTVDPEGDVTGSLELEYDFWQGTSRIVLEGSVADGQTDLKLEFHEKNSFQMTLTVESTVEQSSKAPSSEPPEGDPVVELEDILNGD